MLPLQRLLFLESQDNYVAIFFLEEQKIRKTLLRTSLKTIEQEVDRIPLQRCHRSYMVNLLQVERIKGNAHRLDLYLGEKVGIIPVSRRYVYSIRKAMSAAKKVHQANRHWAMSTDQLIGYPI